MYWKGGREARRQAGRKGGREGGRQAGTEGGREGRKKKKNKKSKIMDTNDLLLVWEERQPGPGPQNWAGQYPGWPYWETPVTHALFEPTWWRCTAQVTQRTWQASRHQTPWVARSSSESIESPEKRKDKTSRYWIVTVQFTGWTWWPNRPQQKWYDQMILIINDIYD